jgi:hypothetical protein
LSAGKPVAVTIKIMAFFEKFEQLIGLEMGLGEAGWIKWLLINTNERSL